MGRSSSTGLPYLIVRPDAGQFTYFRTIPSSLASKVVGTVELRWCKGVRSLSGGKTIKISLQTGDEATARARWAPVHAQVDALVELARIQANPRSMIAPETREVARLTPEQVKTLAGQLRHDVLAEHDRSVLDPTYASPITDIISRLIAKAGVETNHQTREAAQRVGQSVQKRMAVAQTTGRALGGFDVSIVEGEVHPDMIELGGFKPPRGVSVRRLALATHSKTHG